MVRAKRALGENWIIVAGKARADGRMIRGRRAGRNHGPRAPSQWL